MIWFLEKKVLYPNCSYKRCLYIRFLLYTLYSHFLPFFVVDLPIVVIMMGTVNARRREVYLTECGA